MNEKNEGNLNIGKIITKSFENIKEKFSDIVVIGSIFILLPNVILEIVNRKSTKMPLAGMFDSENIISNLTTYLSFGETILGIFIMLLSSIGIAAIVYIIGEKEKDNDVNWKEAMDFIKSRAKDVVLLTLAIIGISSIIGILLVLNSFLLTKILGIGGFILSFIVAVTLLVVIAVYLAFTTQAMVIEGLGVGDSIKRSYHMVKGRFGDVFLKALVVTLITAFISIVITFVIGLIPIISILSTGIAALIGIYSNVAITLMFKDYQEVDRLMMVDTF